MLWRKRFTSSAVSPRLGFGHGASGRDRWMVSYADFITVMMIVGFVMYSISNADLAKFEALAGSLSSALGGKATASTDMGPMQQLPLDLAPIPTQYLPGAPVPIAPLDEDTGYMPDVPDWPAHLIIPEAAEPLTDLPTDVPPRDARPVPDGGFVEPTPPPAPPDALQGIADAFRATPASSTGLLSAALEERGVVIAIAGSVLFDPGQTQLKPGADAVLNQVAERLSHVELPIMVEGTGDLVRGEMEPWDLASLRAGAVIRYLVAEKGLPAEQFVAIGHGGINGDTDGRVNIVVLRKK